MKVLLVENINTTRGAAMSMKAVITLLHERYGVEFTVLQHKNNNLSIYYDSIGVEHIITGHDTHIETSKLYGQTKLKKAYYLLKRLHWAVSNDRKAYKKVLEQVQIKEYDLVYTNLNRYTLGHLISSKNHMPHIVHLREFGDLDFNTVSAIPHFQKKLDKYVCKYIAISQAVKNHYHSFGIENNKIDVIYNGVKVPEVLRGDNILENDVIRMVMVGAITPTKSQLDVVNAIAELPKKYRERIQLDVYGNGDAAYINKLKAAATSGGVQLALKGQVDNIPQVLLNYDIGVTASKAEAFGRVTVEYMMAGVFTIASNTGANSEIIKDKYGFLYEYGNVQSLASEIVKAIENPLRTREIASKACLYAKSEFNDLKNAEAIYRLFRKVVEENAR